MEEKGSSLFGKKKNLEKIGESSDHLKCMYIALQRTD